MSKPASRMGRKSIATADKLVRNRLSPFFDFAQFFTLACCALLSGCKSAPIWSGEAKSPNGKMIAPASTFQNAGFMAGETQTTVYLNWPVGSQFKTLILAYSDGPTARDMAVEMFS